MARKASRKAEKRDVSIDADDRLAMTKALNFILERSRRAQDQIVDLIEETEPFLEFHGERPAEADLHWRIVRNLNELLALFARFEIRALHTLQPGLSVNAD